MSLKTALDLSDTSDYRTTIGQSIGLSDYCATIGLSAHAQLIYFVLAERFLTPMRNGIDMCAFL